MGEGVGHKSRKSAYVAPDIDAFYASLIACLSTILSPVFPNQGPTMEVIGHKGHGAVPEPGCSVIGRVAKLMARMASADIMCAGYKSVPEKFTGIIRQQT